MNDLISREEARGLMYHNQEPLTEYDLDSLPSIEAEPVKHGHWIKTEYPMNPVERLSDIMNFELSAEVECRCSNCDYWDFGELDSYWFDRNYCPNCGAKMDEEVSDDN